MRHGGVNAGEVGSACYVESQDELLTISSIWFRSCSVLLSRCAFLVFSCLFINTQSLSWAWPLPGVKNGRNHQNVNEFMFLFSVSEEVGFVLGQTYVPVQ